jgi:acyl carrier protein
MKSLEEFVELFAEQFDDTDASEIKASTVFHDLDEWSSLIGLSVIAMVDEEYDVTIKGNDINGSDSIEDLFNIVKSRKA